MICIGVAAVLLVLFEGRSVRHAGREMRPGWQRSLVVAVGGPAGWVADRLPLAELSARATRWLKPDSELAASGPGGFGESERAAARAGGVPPVGPDAFDPAALGERSSRPRALRTVLVTGDSMSMSLDADLARRLAGRAGLKTRRDPRVGTGISQSEIVDWGRLSRAQVERDRPDAVVVFIGANEGFPMRVGGRQVRCCGAAWAAEYAYRARRMMFTYRQGGSARVYWLKLPAPRDRDRQRIARVVNAAIDVAAQPYRAQVRVLDLSALFTPGGRYRDAMPIGPAERIVREADGIHLNQAGSKLAAERVLVALRADFGAAVPG